MTSLILGDPCWCSWTDRWHHGALHWVLYPQWDRDSLLPCEVLFLIEIEQGRLSKEIRKSTYALSFEHYLNFMYRCLDQILIISVFSNKWEKRTSCLTFVYLCIAAITSAGIVGQHLSCSHLIQMFAVCASIGWMEL